MNCFKQKEKKNPFLFEFKMNKNCFNYFES